MNPIPYVIFSAIREPEKTILQQSLELMHIAENSLVITSSKFSEHWKSRISNVQLIKYDPLSMEKRFLRKIMNRSRPFRKIFELISDFGDRELHRYLMPPHNARHFEYLYALNHLSSKDWVMLVDSRDLVFQIKPNEVLSKIDLRTKIHLFQENGLFYKDGSQQMNGDSPANWEWLRQLRNFNEQDIEFLKQTKIINSGCIIGEVGALRTFLEESCKLMVSSHSSGIALLDQASVNYLAYSPSNNHDIQLHENGDIVLNMCGVVAKKSSIQNGRMFLDDDLIPIVHQFDRFGSWNSKSGFCFDKINYEVQ